MAFQRFKTSGQDAWMQRIFGTNLVSTLALYSSRFFSKSTPYITKVGIPEFVNGIGNGVESHVAKLPEASCLSYPQAQEAGHSLQTQEVNVEICTQVQAGIMEAAS